MTQAILRVYAVVGLVVVAAAGAAGCGTARGEAALAGDQLYRSCSSCHGTDGQGDPSLGAPAIAGMPRWYVAAQLQRFKDGRRGKHFDDVEGLKMRAMAMQMATPAEVDAVSAYVASLPAHRSAPTLTGTDAAVGQAKFAVCTACHGAKGEGNEALNAPPIAGMEDWYVARQLRKFHAGVRGTVADDPVGAQMAGMAMTVLPNEVDSVAAYVQSLSK